MFYKQQVYLPLPMHFSNMAAHVYNVNAKMLYLTFWQHWVFA